MKINDLLKQEPASVDRDAAPLLRHLSAWTNVAWPWWERRADVALERAGFSMAWLRKHDRHHDRPLRRVWLCGFVMDGEHPCALLQSAGREGDDEWSVFVFDRDRLEALLCRMFDRSRVRLVERFPDGQRRVSFVERYHHDPGIGAHWGACLRCAWRGSENLDEYDMPESSPECPGTHG